MYTLTKNLFKTNNKFSLMMAFPPCHLIILLKQSPVHLKPVRVGRGGPWSGRESTTAGALGVGGGPMSPTHCHTDGHLSLQGFLENSLDGCKGVTVEGGIDCDPGGGVYWTL